MPACATPVGEDLAFGIEEDEASLITQSLKVTHKRDKKEVRDKCGSVISVAHYNRTSDIEIQGVRKAEFALDIGDDLELSNTINPAVVGKMIIDEISTEMSNEDFVKTTIKATAYELIL